MSYKFSTDIICPWDSNAWDRLEEYRKYYQVKYDIISSIQPKKIVEIGVRAGYSAYYFLQAVPSAEYVGYDGDHTLDGVIHDLNICFKDAPKNSHFLVDDIDYLQQVSSGVDKWIAGNLDSISFEYIKSLRGEMLIRKVVN